MSKKQNELTLIDVGSPVSILGDISAVVIAIIIMDKHHVRYEVIYPHGDAMNTMCLDSFLVKPKQSSALKIGFGATPQA